MLPPLSQPAAEPGESLQHATANNLHGTDTERQDPDTVTGGHNGGSQHAAGVSGSPPPFSILT